VNGAADLAAGERAGVRAGAEVPADRRVVLLAWLVLCGLLFAVAAPRSDLPGPYYDEAFMAQQAKDFFEPDRGLLHPASTRQIEVFGRPFPLRNAVYLGATKSQWLIPVFAVFGSDLRVVRLATLAVGMLALLFAMLWAQRVLGQPAALLTGWLVASDPSLLFFSLYEWGPITTLLFCRVAGLWLVTIGWLDGKRWPMAIGGLLLGLGVFTRADLVVVPVAAALALALVRPDLIRTALTEKRDLVAVLALATFVGASPMLLSVADLLAMSESPVILSRGDLAEKLRVFSSLADGSRFYRVIDAGGRFHAMFDGPAPRSFFGAVVLASVALLGGIAWLRPAARAEAAAPAFLLLAGALVSAAMLAVPGAVRAHHLLNPAPLFHLGVAAVAVLAWRRAGWPGRAVLAGVGIALAIANGIVIRDTYALIERSGGRGRWSDAIHEPARELEARPDTRGVSLDWGLHEPLLFLTRDAQLFEAVWEIGPAVRRQGEYRLRGAAGDLYLLHEGDYDLFGYGSRFLAAARRLEARAPGSAVIQEHTDREGRTAFFSVRVDREHEAVFRRTIRIELLDEGER